MSIESLFDRAGAPGRVSSGSEPAALAQAGPLQQWRSVVLWGAASALCTAVVAGILGLFGVWSAADGAFDLMAGGLPKALWWSAILTPITETLILGALYAVLTTAFDPRPAAVLAGLGMAAMHALKGWPAAVCVVIPFLILAAPFASSRLSWRGALLRSAGIHAVHNACVILLAAVVIQLTGGNGWTLVPGT